MTTVSATVLSLAIASGSGTAAQAAAAPQPAQAQSARAPAIEEIVVTGTRIIRNGFEAPTPTMVMSSDDINAMAPTQMMDVVTQLPALAGSTTPETGHTGVSAGIAGISSINLRNMGSNRTLVLFDGKRIVPARLTGEPDINQVPDALVSRVDVVTGGASAAYGSDAVAGVVNFILDKNFVGIKGDIVSGITTYGDGARVKTSLNYGATFGNGRGHILFAADWARNSMVKGQSDRYPLTTNLQDNEFVRPWYNQSLYAMVINNPAYTATNGQPRQLAANNVHLATAAPGFLVTTGPLKGLVFDQGGTTRQFDYGVVSGNLMVGGENNEIGDFQTLDAYLGRYATFMRASYEIGENTEAWFEAAYAYAHTRTVCCAHFNLGSINVPIDNPFLPPEVVARMQAAGVTSLRGGSYVKDLGGISTEGKRATRRFAFGLDGKFTSMDTDWTWNFFTQFGIAPTTNNVFLYSRANFAAAIDAVRDPSTGNIVCRSVLNGTPSQFQDPGCVPFNILGWGTASQEAIKYVLGFSRLSQSFHQNVISGSMQGEPFSTWAGPVSLALGVEHRSESIKSLANPNGENDQWFAANFKATNGAYNVTEGFVEAVIPLAKGNHLAEALDLDLALRATSYSTSGLVETWKIGVNYNPISDLRIRATRSRDIRAPNLNELFLAGQVNTQTVNDPFRNNEQVVILRPQIGNPNLKPEKADTTGLGAVYSPSWFPGFTASVDYYNINMSGRIGTLSNQETADRCFAGNQELCKFIERDSTGTIFRLTVQPINFVQSTDRGIDFEAAWRIPLADIDPDWFGSVTLSGLATHNIKSTIDDGKTVTVSTGAGPNRSWRLRGQIIFDQDPLKMVLTGRYIGAGVLNANWIECKSNCPASVSPNLTIDNNRTPSAFYMNLAVTYTLWNDDTNRKVDIFANCDNMWNKPAGLVYNTGSLNFIGNGTDPTVYDTLGRTFRLGMRFRM